jgi:hypothetical protein
METEKIKFSGRTVFRVFLKRQLVSPLRLVLLILMILSALIVNRLTLPRQETRTVLLYQETGSGESEENGDESRTADRQADSSGSLTVNVGDSLSGNCLIDSLEEGSGMFVFRTAGSRGELEREVRRGGVECGFILPADYAERLAEGNLAGLITYVSSPYTRRGETAKETVFATFIRQYAPEILKDAAPELYETGDQPDDDEALDTLIRQKFDALREGSTIFHTEFRTVKLSEENTAGESDEASGETSGEAYDETSDGAFGESTGTEAEVEPESSSDRKTREIFPAAVLFLLSANILLAGAGRRRSGLLSLEHALPHGLRERTDLLYLSSASGLPAAAGFILMAVLQTAEGKTVAGTGLAAVLLVLSLLLLTVLTSLLSIAAAFLLGRIFREELSYLNAVIILLLAAAALTGFLIEI